MTLPEHAICSLMVAQLAGQERLGLRGVICVVVAGICPDIDTATKLFGESYFWRMHHALGHNVLSVMIISAAIACAGSRCGRLSNGRYLFAWCMTAAVLHCLTDSLYWWGIQPFWPLAGVEVCLNVIEYLDLFVLAIWLVPAVLLYAYYDRARQIAICTLATFIVYVALRAALPPPTGILHLITGGWMYAVPNGTPVLDWW